MQGTAASFPESSDKTFRTKQMFEKKIFSRNTETKFGTFPIYFCVFVEKSHDSTEEGFPSSSDRSHRLGLTRFLVGVSAAGLPESHQGSEVGPQHRPAEGRHGVDAHQAADEGVLAALEQGHDVGTHVVSVLLPKVLRETQTPDCHSRQVQGQNQAAVAFLPFLKNIPHLQPRSLCATRKLFPCN